MTDNPRYALYGSPYTILPVLSHEDASEETVSVVGRCCESGDIIQENVSLPNDLRRGDLIACLTTGAYHYSMASNYNRIPRPPVVMLNDGESYVAVRRETPDDIVRLDV
jgi:diaminopimelate decarboxylase